MSLNKTRVIFLAAGQGTRLAPLTLEKPKSLLPVAGEPLLIRTIRQMKEAGFSNVSVVLGHRAEEISSILNNTFTDVEICINSHYKNDTNSGSLLVGINNRIEPTLVIEADVAMTKDAANSVYAACQQMESVWFSNGSFQSHQLGGILKSDGSGKLTDLRLVKAWEEQYASYSKVLGVVFIGPKEIGMFHELLSSSVKQSTKHYYMEPWIWHLDALPAREVNLSSKAAFSFNTLKEYEACCRLFEQERN